MSVSGLKFFVALLLLSGCAHRAALEEGCRSGLRNRCLELGEDLLVHREEHAALQWFGRACELGHHAACMRYALFFEWGWGVEQDRPRARNLYDTACRMGLPEACRSRDRLDELDGVCLCVPGEDHRLFAARVEEAKRLQGESLRICHQLSTDRSIPVDLTMLVDVGKDGRAHAAMIEENSRKDLGVGVCAQELLMKWHYPCPPEQLRLELRFAFRP